METTGLYGISRQSLFKNKARIGQSPYFYEVSYEEAIDWAKCALAINPKNKVSVDRLISIFMKIKDYNQALPWTKKLVDIWPIAENYYFLAFLYYNLDTLPNYENLAKDNINQALKLSPYNEKYHDLRNEIDSISTLNSEDG